MNNDVSVYAQRLEARLSATLDDWLPPTTAVPIVEPYRGEPGARICAALADNPGGLHLAMLCWLCDLEWSIVYEQMSRAMRVGRMRSWEGRPFKSQGEMVSGSIRYCLVERQQRRNG